MVTDFVLLDRTHISNASKDLGSLWNSDTDVEFPLVSAAPFADLFSPMNC